MRLLYSLFMCLSAMFIMLYFGLRGIRDHRYWHRWGERLGLGPVVEADLIVHCASLGEVNAASPLVQALQQQYPDWRMMVTTFTPTGSERAKTLFGERVTHRYLPLDLPWAPRRLLTMVAPRALLIMETEVWPNLYHAAQTLEIPLFIFNARMSERSLKSYRKFDGLIAPALAGVSLIGAQGETDAGRFIACGGRPDRTSVTGNLKFDITIPASCRETGEMLRAGWGSHRPVLVAGSTHEADEEALLQAFESLLPRFPALLLVIAPRHPERFGRVAQKVLARGLVCTLRSAGEMPTANTNCLLVDTLGELLQFYAAADVAFVGGTIAAIGGHNVLEPAALGRPLLVGPHTENVADTTAQLIESGAAVRVSDADQMATELGRIFADAGLRDRMGRAGDKLVASGRGALEKTLALVNRTLGSGQPPADSTNSESG